MSSPATLKDRKAAVLQNLREGRKLLERTLEDAQPDELYKVSQWGVVDAVRHMSGGLQYRAMIDRTLSEDRPKYPAWPSAEESWSQMKSQLLAEADQAIGFVEGLTDEQLQRVAICGEDEVPVIQFLEWGGGHYLEHGNQIANEILPMARGK
jgi:DinB family protein